MQKLLNYINGELVNPVTGNFFENINPAEGKPYSLVPDSGAADVALATEAATRAFAAWSTTPAKNRSVILLKIAALIERDLDQLALAESTDQGKPVALQKHWIYHGLQPTFGFMPPPFCTKVLILTLLIMTQSTIRSIHR